MLHGQVLIIDTQAIEKLPLKKILFQGLYSTGFSIHRIFGIFLVLGHNWAHALARCSRLLRIASPRLHFVQHKNAWVSNTNQSYFSFLQVSFIYSIQNKELIDGKIFGSQSKALDKIWIDKKGGVATFLL